MILTEQQQKWNESIEKLLNKKKSLKEDSYGNEKYNETIFELYKELKDKVLKSINFKANIVEKSNYISFKTKKSNRNFVNVQMQKLAIKCIINLKKLNIKNKRLLRDVSRVGHFGSGNYEATIKSKKDILICLPFIIKSYDKNS